MDARPSVARVRRQAAPDPARRHASRTARERADATAGATALRPITLVEMLAGRLRAMIVDRGLPPGSRLGTKTELARQHGVSVGTVHAAVRLLEAQGLAEGRPGVGGGVFVSQAQPHLALASLLFTLRDSTDQDSARDMLEARAALDVLLVRRAAQERRDADIRALRAALAALEAAGTDPPDDMGRYLRLDWALHDVIAQAGHNATLLAAYRTILGFFTTQVQDILPRPYTVLAVQQNLALHRAIVDSIVAGDQEAATRYAEQHRQRLVPQGRR